MPEEAPSQTTPEPRPKPILEPRPEEKEKPAPKEEPEKKKVPGKWLRKIPRDILFSPGGVILVIFAIFMEILDPLLPGGSLTVEIIPELFFMLLMKVTIPGFSFSNMAVPFLIERLPGISDILPTWLLKMFGLI